jgi:predicted O-methyltransferase YrrM
MLLLQIITVSEPPEASRSIKKALAFLRECSNEFAARGDRLRQLKDDSALTVWLALRLTRVRRVVEIGTGSGFSTVWIADALRMDPSARLLTFEPDADRVVLANKALLLAKLSNVVMIQDEFHVNHLTEVGFDLVDAVFIDCWKPAYKNIWLEIQPFLTTSALILADNAVSHEGELAEFLQAAYSDRRFDTFVFPVGDGLLFAKLR